MSRFCSLCIHFAGCKCWARFIQNDQIQHFIPVLLSKIEFRGVQKQKGKLVFSKTFFFFFFFFFGFFFFFAYGILYPP